MSIICNNCGFDENPDGTEFCEACGSELTVTSSPSTPIESDYSPPEPTIMPPMDSIPSPTPVPQEISSMDSMSPSIMGTAKLVAKQSGSPQSEFELSSSEHSIVGRFDETTGPVDIDLGNFP